jgi:hypothetical protein
MQIKNALRRCHFSQMLSGRTPHGKGKYCVNKLFKWHLKSLNDNEEAPRAAQKDNQLSTHRISLLSW